MIRIERDNDVAVLVFNRPPVNAIEQGFVDSLSAALEECRQDEPVRGLVLTADHPKTFSSGLDLKALAGYDRPTFEHFVHEFAQLSRTLFAFPKPVIAAVNGHAIAGGYLLAATADRILAADGGGTVGLSEVRLAVPIPSPNLELLRTRLSPRVLEEVVLGAVAHPIAQALSLGLVDRVVPAAELRGEAVALARSLGSAPRGTWAQMKSRLRDRVLRRAAAAEVELHDFVDAWYSPDAVEAREKLLKK